MSGSHPPPPGPPVAPGSARVGRFALVTELGSGPLGSSWIGYIAEGPERGRLVAARRIRTGTDVLAAAKLERAANLAKEVRHAKIAAVLDVVRMPGEVVVISEHMDGEPLSSLLFESVVQGAPIAPPVAIAIVRDLVEATMAVRDGWLAALPRPDDPLGPCVHGGLGPDGVMVATFGEALLTEIGIAGTAASLARFTRDASALPYRAPEQLVATRAPDERADVFTMGVILWEMLAGAPLFGPSERLRRPSATGLVRELERELREKPIPSLDTVQRPGAPLKPELALLTARALQRDPAHRYASLDELRTAIAALSDGLVASAEQVATTVDRLARERIEDRRSEFERTVGGRVVGSSPPSSLSASELAGPASRPIAVIVPGDQWTGERLSDIIGFEADELPTRSGAPSPATVRARLPAASVARTAPLALAVSPPGLVPPPVLVTPPVVAPPPVPARPSPPPGPQAPSDPPAPEPFAVAEPALATPPSTLAEPARAAAPAPSDAPERSRETAAPEAFPPTLLEPTSAPSWSTRRAARTASLVAALLFTVVVVGVGVAVVLLQHAPPARDLDPEARDPAATMSEIGSGPASATPAPMEESAVPGSPSADEAPRAAAGSAAADLATPPASGALPRKTWGRGTEPPTTTAAPAPGPGEKGYRPSGI